MDPIIVPAYAELQSSKSIEEDGLRGHNPVYDCTVSGRAYCDRRHVFCAMKSPCATENF